MFYAHRYDDDGKDTVSVIEKGKGPVAEGLPEFDSIEQLKATFPGAVFNGIPDEGDAPDVATAEPEPEITSFMIAPVNFKQRFMPMERVAIRSKMISEDPQDAQIRLMLEVFFEDLDDPRVTEINLLSPGVQQGLALLEQSGFLTAERREEIGTP